VHRGRVHAQARCHLAHAEGAEAELVDLLERDFGDALPGQRCAA
jgi:hypothetical protein